MTTFADRLKRFRGEHGGTITISGLHHGTTAAVTMEPLSLSEVPDWIPDGARNAGNLDPHLVNMTPSDFATPPHENQTFDMLGTTYVIARIPRPVVSNVVHTYACLCYRAPVIGTSSQDDAQLAQWTLPT